MSCTGSRCITPSIMSTCWLAFSCDSASSRASSTLEVMSRHADEHVLDALLTHDAVEVELQIARVAAAVAVVRPGSRAARAG